MAFKNYIASQDVVAFDCRCIRCKQGLDREGRYCRRCLRGQRLKLLFGTLAFAQLGVAAFIIMRSADAARMVHSEGGHIITVATANNQTGWVYYDVTDPLIEDVTHHARLIANTPQAPKNAPATPGATGGTLEISASRHYGRAVTITFPLVKQACGANVCALNIIFDKQPPTSTEYHDVSDARTTTIMLTDPSAFLNALANAHDLTVVASLGTDKDTVLIFGVAGFRMKLAALIRQIRAAELGWVARG